MNGAGATFTELCARYAGDIPATTMMKELKRVGAVEQDAEGKLNVRRRYYMPTQFDPQWIMNAGSTFADLGDNINYNLISDADNPSRFWVGPRKTVSMLPRYPNSNSLLNSTASRFWNSSMIGWPRIAGKNRSLVATARYVWAQGCS